MPITPNFSSTESISSNNLVTFNDTSTGSDGTLTVRHIYVLQADGTYLVPSGTTTDYIVWDYADASIEVNLITQSTAASVTVIWLAGTTAAYNKTIAQEWNFYDYLFLFGLLGTQTSHPSIIDDNVFYGNTLTMIVNLFQAENAITNMDDVYSAQSALNRNQYLINNQQYAF